MCFFLYRMTETKQTFHVVVYNSDDGLFVINLPIDIANTLESQEILKAISGNDPRFRPYTSIGEEYEKNKNYVKHIVEKIKTWNELYGIEFGTKTQFVTFGGEYC